MTRGRVPMEEDEGGGKPRGVGRPKKERDLEEGEGAHLNLLVGDAEAKEGEDALDRDGAAATAALRRRLRKRTTARDGRGAVRLLLLLGLAVLRLLLAAVADRRRRTRRRSVLACARGVVRERESEAGEAGRGG